MKIFKYGREKQSYIGIGIWKFYLVWWHIKDWRIENKYGFLNIGLGHLQIAIGDFHL